MPVISKRFADELTEKEMRDAYLDEKTRGKLALQIRENRIQRGWSQADMGGRMDKPQSNIARLEDRDVARYTLTTLLELASAYDCGLVVEFVPYSEFLQRTHDLRLENLRVASFDRAGLEPLCRDVTATTKLPHADRLQIAAAATPRGLHIDPTVDLALARHGRELSEIGASTSTITASQIIAPSGASSFVRLTDIIDRPIRSMSHTPRHLGADLISKVSATNPEIQEVANG